MGVTLALGLVLTGEPASRWYYQSRSSEPTVVLFVMDTVRADHLSECGYARPTSPTLSYLHESGATVRCDAVAPSSWTVPSHASMFTGQQVPDHGAHFVHGGQTLQFGESPVTVRPLAADAVTLAERFKERGYQTALVSSNGFVSASTGLAQGFDLTWSSGGRWWSGRQVVEILHGILSGGLNPERPLFLVLNVTDAHSPWPTVPSGVTWVPPQAPPPSDRREEHPRGLTDVYDYGVFLEDAALGASLSLLRDYGWTASGLRLVVASDHGELLGEHGLFDHCKTAYEPVVTVPLLYYQEPGPTPPILGERPSLIEAHSLLLDGTTAGHSRLSATFPVAGMANAGDQTDSIWAAEWNGSQKRVWHHGQYLAYDLDADPAELTPLPVPATAVSGEFAAYVEQLEASSHRTADHRVDDSLQQQLKAMGYLE